MASPEKAVLSLVCKAGVVTFKVKHNHRGVLREFSMPASCSDFTLDIPNCAALFPKEKNAPEPKPAATAKSVAPPVEPVTEPGPEEDFRSPVTEGETRAPKRRAKKD